MRNVQPSQSIAYENGVSDSSQSCASGAAYQTRHISEIYYVME